VPETIQITFDAMVATGSIYFAPGQIVELPDREGVWRVRDVRGGGRGQRTATLDKIEFLTPGDREALQQWDPFKGWEKTPTQESGAAEDDQNADGQG
jgi:hypothetical protein